MNRRSIQAWTAILMVCAAAGCQASPPTAALPVFYMAVTPAMETMARGLLEGYQTAYPLDHSLQITVASPDAVRNNLDQGRVSAAMEWNTPAADNWSARIGWTGIVIIVNPQNSVANLSREQARDIFLGLINRWEAVGGPAGDIHRAQYDPGQDLAGLFEGIVLEGGRMANGFQAVPAAYAMLEVVRKDANAIGYLPGFDFSHVVRPLAIDHVSAGYANLITEKYPFRAAVYLTAKNPAPAPVQRFAAWAQSVAGQSVFLSMQTVE
jgi:ABC-type phosphate transport system substrate-binding protein